MVKSKYEMDFFDTVVERNRFSIRIVSEDGEGKRSGRSCVETSAEMNLYDNGAKLDADRSLE